MEDETFNRIYYICLFIGLIAFLVGAGLLMSNLHDGKEFCESVNGTYELHLLALPPSQLCNDKIIYHYTTGWNFEIPTNITISAEE